MTLHLRGGSRKWEPLTFASAALNAKAARKKGRAGQGAERELIISVFILQKLELNSREMCPNV